MVRGPQRGLSPFCEYKTCKFRASWDSTRTTVHAHCMHARSCNPCFIPMKTMTSWEHKKNAPSNLSLSPSSLIRMKASITRDKGIHGCQACPAPIVWKSPPNTSSPLLLGLTPPCTEPQPHMAQWFTQFAAPHASPLGYQSRQQHADSGYNQQTASTCCRQCPVTGDQPLSPVPICTGKRRYFGPFLPFLNIVSSTASAACQQCFQFADRVCL